MRASLFVAFFGVFIPFAFGEAFLFKSKNQNTENVITKIIVENVVESAAQDPNLQEFVIALQETGLDTILQGPGPYTIFAPNNEAFKELGNESNKEKLKEILLYHIVPGRLSISDLKTDTLPTANGKQLTVKGTTVNGAQILKDNIEASNGVVYIIDKVLIPEN